MTEILQNTVYIKDEVDKAILDFFFIEKFFRQESLRASLQTPATKAKTINVRE